MKTYKVTVELEDVLLPDDSDEESVREIVKDALQTAIEMDDDGEEPLVFNIEEEEEDGDCF